MREDKDNSIYLHHINDSIVEILHYLDRSNFETFSKNTWDQAAIMRYLEIIGDFPSKGQIIQFKNFTFEIDAIDNRRIKQIKVKKNVEK